MEPYESLSAEMVDKLDEKPPYVEFCPVCREQFFTASDEIDHAWLHIDLGKTKKGRKWQD